MADARECGERENRAYIAIDLKSFYASAECVARGRDPLTTNLVVADVSRTSKTICLAVSPSLKQLGIGGRARLFEVQQAIARENERRRCALPTRTLAGSSDDATILTQHPQMAVSYIAAKPRMSYYEELSGAVYGVYLRYASERDIHVYSIDEVFIDVTHYLRAHGMGARELAGVMVRDVLAATGITATAGIGTNMYLAKVAMDIVAKHIPADEHGVRVAELDERSYRQLLWGHRPLTDFWRIGRGTARRLEEHGMLTMGDVARCSLGSPNEYYNEELLYRLFGVNAELLIDHAWGAESCTIADIKSYRPAENSIGSGQVLQQPYTASQARIVVREMADALALSLVEQGLVADRIALSVAYDRGSPTFSGSSGSAVMDRYGRSVPKPSQGARDLGEYTSSMRRIAQAAVRLYDDIVDTKMLVRHVNITACRVVRREDAADRQRYVQPDLFAADDSVHERGGGIRSGSSELGMRELNADAVADDATSAGEREYEVQRTLLAVKHKFGNNAVLTGTNLEPCATGRQRNEQIGGHAA